MIRERIQATGVGFAGIVGAWWLPAVAPFALPPALAADLAQIGGACFALFDAVTALYRTPDGAAGGLDALLDYNVPADIPRLMGPGQVLAVRPDLQLCPRAGPSRYALVATELELCPSAHGFAHAMQVGYGLATDLVAAFVRMLAGRELIFVSTSQWSEFLWEQLAFCRAMAEAGARARVLCDVSISVLAARVRRGEIWQPPMFGVRERPVGWRDDVRARIREQGFAPFLWPEADEWPTNIGAAVVFRFGYFDCFSAAQLQQMLQWQASGATFLNPTSFILDSKAVLAALALPAVRGRIAADALATLDRCIPETVLLRPERLAQLRAERADWVVKYAGYDRGNQAWGGRSLQVGALHTPDGWARTLDECLALAWPVVAQRIAPTAQIDIAYRDADNALRWMRGGATRLRSFMLRGDPGQRATVCGAHLTVSGGTMQVSEGTDAVQAPVIFQETRA